MKTLLVDSNFVCHRALFATGGFNSGDTPTGVIYGFFSQLFNVLKKTKPSRVLFFWDSKRSVRKEIYPEYKSKRRQNKTEYELAQYKKASKQFSLIRRQILPYIGIHNSFMQPGYESDDLIAEYVLSATDDEKMLIASSDKDFYQVLGPNCSMYLLKQSAYYLYQDFLKDYRGLNPVLWADIKAIAGCTSDNVPGIVGIGEKRALAILLKDGPISEHSYIQRTAKTVAGNLELVQRNYKLVRLPFDGTIDIRSKIVDNTFSMKRFLHICREYGFQSFRTEDKRKEIKELLSNI